MIYRSIDDLMNKAQEAEGKTFGEIDKTGRIQNTRSKGVLGNIIEESHFGYSLNSDSVPDFENLGVELKVTAFKQNKNGSYSAKERLVLNMIDYWKEHSLRFETSSFMSKSAKMLIMLYKYEQNVPIEQFFVHKAFLNEFSEEDIAVMRRDWETIVGKIRNGQAHLLSEADTMYLSACTKGANGDVSRTQPFSSEPAKPRAFALKASYVTGIIRRQLDPTRVESLSSQGELKTMTIEQLLERRFAPHYGKTLLDLCSEVGIPYNPKNKAMIPRIMANLLGIRGTDLSHVEEFMKANIRFKSVRLEPNGSIREHMSFPNIDFDHLIENDWEDSELYELFAEQKYLLLLFRFEEPYQKDVSRIPVFEGFRIWNMPANILENHVREFWQVLRETVQKGVVLTQTNKGVKNNLPGPAPDQVCHVRPKAKNGKDTVRLPDGQNITKQAYWLDRNYIQHIIEQ